MPPPTHPRNPSEPARSATNSAPNRRDSARSASNAANATSRRNTNPASTSSAARPEASTSSAATGSAAGTRADYAPQDQPHHHQDHGVSPRSRQTTHPHPTPTRPPDEATHRITEYLPREQYGTVKFWHPLGYGFISAGGGDQEYYARSGRVAGGYLRQGDEVSFAFVAGHDGKTQAVNVKVLHW